MEHNSDFKYDLQLGLKGENLVAKMLSNEKIEVKINGINTSETVKY